MLSAIAAVLVIAISCLEFVSSFVLRMSCFGFRALAFAKLFYYLAFCCFPARVFLAIPARRDGYVCLRPAATSFNVRP
jgi:hypothetical protein